MRQRRDGHRLRAGQHPAVDHHDEARRPAQITSVLNKGGQLLGDFVYRTSEGLRSGD